MLIGIPSFKATRLLCCPQKENARELIVVRVPRVKMHPNVRGTAPGTNLEMQEVLPCS